MPDANLSKTVQRFAQGLLSEGAHPAELSYSLIVEAGRIGLDLAPNAGVALALVMKATSDVAMGWVEEQKSGPSKDELSLIPPETKLH